MKTATVKELKTELSECSTQELIALCLRLSRFKKENKELLTYLLIESHDEEAYVQGIQQEMDVLFEQINTSSYYFMKKSVRKILRRIKTYIRYSQHKETEVELLLYFCKKMSTLRPTITKNKVLHNLLSREVAAIQKKINVLHEDLQYDYRLELEEIQS